MRPLIIRVLLFHDPKQFFASIFDSLGDGLFPTGFDEPEVETAPAWPELSLPRIRPCLQPSTTIDRLPSRQHKMPTEHAINALNDLLQYDSLQVKLCADCHRPLTAAEPAVVHRASSSSSQHGNTTADSNSICAACREKRTSRSNTLQSSPGGTMGAIDTMMVLDTPASPLIEASDIELVGGNGASTLTRSTIQSPSSRATRGRAISPIAQRRSLSTASTSSPSTSDPQLASPGPAHGRVGISSDHVSSPTSPSSSPRQIRRRSTSRLTPVNSPTDPLRHAIARARQASTTTVGALSPPSSPSLISTITTRSLLASQSLQSIPPPDPLLDITRLRVPSHSYGCLYPGSRFQGTQKSGRNSYDVTVTIVVSNRASAFRGATP